jgi:hypothetical protein
MRKRLSLQDVAHRRAELLARAQAERERVAGEFRSLRGATVWVDRGMEAAKYLRAHPLVLAGAGIAVLVVFRRPFLRGGWVRVIQRGFVAWRGILALRAVAVRLAH